MSSPSRPIATFNALHLGDNLVHLHFLRKLAQAYPEIAFTHGAPDQHLAQLYPLWQDLPNLTVTSIGITPPGAINAWCGANGWWYQQPDTTDWLAAYTRWLDHLAGMMGLTNPIQQRTDFLFDYPALKDADHPNWGLPWKPGILIINSPPKSGQWSLYNSDQFTQLAALLMQAGHEVATTAETGIPEIYCTRRGGHDVTAIGKASQRSHTIIGCVTGPMWCTHSIWNDPQTLRIHLQDREHVNITPNTIHTNSLSLVPELLRERCLL